MGNVELFKLCETIPKVKCSECLVCWNQGIVYCTCGHLLRESESSRHLHQWRLDAHPIPNYIIRKGRPRGARHGKTEAQQEHFIGHNASKRCIEKNFKGIQERLDISWFATQNWSDWSNMHPDGRGGAERFHLSPVIRGVWEVYEKRVYLTEHIWQKCTDETPIRLPRSINKYAPSSPWVWRRATCTDSFLPVSEMAFVVFFIQYIIVAVEWPLVKLIKSSKSITSELVKERHLERGDPLCVFFTKLLRSDTLQDFFWKKL